MAKIGCKLIMSLGRLNELEQSLSCLSCFLSALSIQTVDGTQLQFPSGFHSVAESSTQMQLKHVQEKDRKADAHNESMVHHMCIYYFSL